MTRPDLTVGQGDCSVRGVAPRSDRSWAPFLVVVAAIVLALAASGTPSPLYVDYQREWHLTPTVVTVVYALYAGGVVVTLLLAGGLSDRLGRRPVLIGSLLVLLGALLLFLAAGSPVWLCAARLVQGLATGVFTGAAGSALADLHPRRDARVAALTNSTATSLGIAGGAMLAGALAEWAPAPQLTPYAVVAVAVVGVLCGVLAHVPAPAASGGGQSRNLVRVQPIRVPRGILAPFLIGVMGVVAAWSVGGLFLGLGGNLAQNLLHVHNHLVIGLVILMVQGVGGVAQLLLRGLATVRATVLGCAALVVGMALVALSIHLVDAAVFLIGCCAAGVGFGLTFMGSTRVVTEAAPARQMGEVLAAYFLIAYLAISVPVMAAGAIATRIGLTSSFYLFAAVMSVVAAATAVCAIAQVRRPA